MTDALTVVLGGKPYPVRELPFRDVKVITTTFNRIGLALSVGKLDERAIDDMGAVVALGVGLEAEAFAALPMRFDELSEAVQVVAQAAGLVRPAGDKEPASGEVAGIGNGTISMPSSSSIQDGPGNTSTDT